MAILFTAAGIAGAVDFDRPSGKLELPPAPEATPLPAPMFEKAAQPQEPYALLFGKYTLEKEELGNCYKDIEAVPASFNGSVTKRDLQISGLTDGLGDLVAHVMEINAGLQGDRNMSPGPLMPWDSGFRGYAMREASFAGEKLVYKTGDRLFMVKPLTLTKGHIKVIELGDGKLSIRSGQFSGNDATFTNSCLYKRI
jgi:hypothetical protein